MLHTAVRLVYTVATRRPSAAGSMNRDFLSILETRRSALSITLDEPGPDEEQTRQLIRIASRVPDHGKLAPWRFEVWDMAFRRQMHASLLGRLEALPDVEDREKKKQTTDKLLHGPTLVVAISKAAQHPKIPVWEQTLSAGASCMKLLIAANAMGFEAQWLTAWFVYDDGAKPVLGLGDDELIAGLIHIGSSSVAKNERPRPELDDILQFKTPGTI